MRVFSSWVNLSRDGRPLLEIIVASSDEALGRVDGLLAAVSDADGHRPVLRWEVVDLRVLSEEIVEGHRAHAEPKQQILHCDLFRWKCVDKGDWFRLLEAVGNLVSNCSKCSPANETIKVRDHRSHDTFDCRSLTKAPA